MAAPTLTTFRWAPWWVLLQVALWPAPGIAEGVLTLGALVAIFMLLKQRFRGGGRLLTAEAWALSTAMFLAYWLPQLFSTWDAVNLPRTMREVVVDLRYLPFLWLVAMAVADPRGRRLTFGGIGVIILLWLADGLVQAATGWSLGGASHADRLSGIFGDSNLKLGLVMASLSPFALVLAARRFGVLGWAMVAAGLVIVVLLAGARASWLTLALSLLFTGVWVMGVKRALLVVALGSVVLVGTATLLSDRMGQRVERTQAALSGDAEGVDFALSGRLPIWRTAWAMAQDNWLTGVGSRGFRDAYGDYAEADDPWMQGEWEGAFHAHQLVLELLSETGVIGLLLWLVAAAMVLRAWRWAGPEARMASRCRPWRWPSRCFRSTPTWPSIRPSGAVWPCCWPRCAWAAWGRPSTSATRKRWRTRPGKPKRPARSGRVSRSEVRRVGGA
ncbi:O-antigen ligase [Alkalisalibacterium limincola]|uniref:O-antigen ligase family protein n=1 Tax=Alkalisalibacterium limincola TaxID=2699169 RepID=UPI002AA2A1C4|nr:O-antigen ligase [Alkalisalibacterium limincola]